MRVIRRYYVRRTREEVEDQEVEFEVIEESEDLIVVGRELRETVRSLGLREDPVRV